MRDLYDYGGSRVVFAAAWVNTGLPGDENDNSVVGNKPLHYPPLYDQAASLTTSKLVAEDAGNLSTAIPGGTDGLAPKQTT